MSGDEITPDVVEAEPTPAIQPRWQEAEPVVSAFVISTKTRAHGDKFVVREHRFLSGWDIVRLEPLAIVDTIEEARTVAAGGLNSICFDRVPEDDPVVVELWVRGLAGFEFVRDLRARGRRLEIERFTKGKKRRGGGR